MALMLQVLHVITGLSPDGAEMALYRLVTGERGGCRHAVVSLTPGGAVGERLREADIELTAFDFRVSPLSHFLELLALMRRTRPDIVQTWMYHADMFGGLAARLAGNRNVIWGIRATELKAGDSRATAAVRRLCAWLSRWVPHTIVCVAEAARRTHVAAGYDPARMVVVPNGFDLSQLAATAAQRDELRKQCGFGPGQAVIGTLGRFNANKDQHNFVRAAALLARQHRDVRFLMAGRGLDAGNEELMRWIAQTGHADRFVLLGERSDVPVCLAAMDVFCLSSRTEGFPNAVGEAMAMGVPCVVTDVGDAAMLVGDAGVVVPKEDAHALAGGLAGVLNLAPDARRQLGQKARARIQAEFTMERARERFETIYRRITEEGRR
jgi:glycosyltransferase involved in cell wall biosynthesis